MAIIQQHARGNGSQQHHQQQQRPPVQGDGYQASFVAMLNVMRRIHDMTGDPAIKSIIDDAERSLSRR